MYPGGLALIEALGSELDGLLHGKSTIRFPLDGAFPTRLITKIARLRAAEAAQRTAAKAAKKKAPKKKAPKKKAQRRSSPSGAAQYAEWPSRAGTQISPVSRQSISSSARPSLQKNITSPAQRSVLRVAWI